MAIPTFNATENYDALTMLTEAQLNALASSIETQFNTNTKPNLEQIALDVFGASYVYDNDGAANEATNLKAAAALLADNETITGSWTFSNSVSFSAAVSSSSTFTSSGQMRARAYLATANQTLADATLTSIAFNAESYDVGAMHDNSTNNSRITIPSSGAGIYLFHAQVTFTANATGRRTIHLYKNGSQIAEAKLFNNDGSIETVLQVSAHDNASVNDYFEVKAYQNRGGTLDVVLGERVTFFSAIKVW